MWKSGTGHGKSGSKGRAWYVHLEGGAIPFARVDKSSVLKGLRPDDTSGTLLSAFAFGRDLQLAAFKGDEVIPESLLRQVLLRRLLRTRRRSWSKVIGPPSKAGRG